MTETVAFNAVPAALDTDRTVSRELVHRWSLSEVFLTGYTGLDADRFTCLAQLPLSHAYYRDHVAAGGAHDPLLVLEAARQAMTCAVHAHQGLPRATALLALSWRLSVTEPGALACSVRPGELRIDGTVTERRVRGGQVRRLAFEFGLVLDGRPLGRVDMAIGTTPADQYVALRRMQHGGAIPTAFERSAEPAGTPVCPAEVDRENVGNVVLDSAVRDGDGLTAVLSPRMFANRSMYDHPYDHVPGMVLTEAARQCALLLSDNGSGGGVGRTPVWLSAEFDQFAEVDSPVSLTARPTGEPSRFELIATQAAARVAGIQLRLEAM